MGKGDQRTKRGKIWRGSHGKLRPRKRKRVVLPAETKKKPTPSRTGEKGRGRDTVATAAPPAGVKAAP